MEVIEADVAQSFAELSTIVTKSDNERVVTAAYICSAATTIVL